MTDSISDILKKQVPSEPPEFERIKQFVYEEIGQRPKVSLVNGNFFVYISDAGAAGNLRFKIFQLQRSLGVDKKIIIKIV